MAWHGIEAWRSKSLLGLMAGLGFFGFSDQEKELKLEKFAKKQ